MSHILNLLLKIIHKKIYSKLKEDISNRDFGFQESDGTGEALFGINVVFQRCLDMNQDVFASYIDFQKVADKVKHDKLQHHYLGRQKYEH